MQPACLQLDYQIPTTSHRHKNKLNPLTQGLVNLDT